MTDICSDFGLRGRCLGDIQLIFKQCHLHHWNILHKNINDKVHNDQNGQVNIWKFKSYIFQMKCYDLIPGSRDYGLQNVMWDKTQINPFLCQTLTCSKIFSFEWISIHFWTSDKGTMFVRNFVFVKKQEVIERQHSLMKTRRSCFYWRLLLEWKHFYLTYDVKTGVLRA